MKIVVWILVTVPIPLTVVYLYDNHDAVEKEDGFYKQE